MIKHSSKLNNMLTIRFLLPSLLSFILLDNFLICSAVDNNANDIIKKIGTKLSQNKIIPKEFDNYLSESRDSSVEPDQEFINSPKHKHKMWTENNNNKDLVDPKQSNVQYSCENNVMPKKPDDSIIDVMENSDGASQLFTFNDFKNNDKVDEDEMNGPSKLHDLTFGDLKNQETNFKILSNRLVIYEHENLKESPNLPINKLTHRYTTDQEQLIESPMPARYIDLKPYGYKVITKLYPATDNTETIDFKSNIFKEYQNNSKTLNCPLSSELTNKQISKLPTKTSITSSIKNSNKKKNKSKCMCVIY